jgi:hypothetical protein
MELHLAKMRMDQDFQKNRVLPGDPRYEYDKQVCDNLNSSSPFLLCLFITKHALVADAPL